MHPQQQIARLRNLMHGVGGAEQGLSAALSFLVLDVQFTQVLLGLMPLG
jgi:hypothetical protein